MEKVEIVTITADKAKELLVFNDKNRPISMSHVKKLEKQMVAGKWDFNGDTIRMSKSMLLDGQHRLKACVNTGISFKAVLITGLDDSVFTTIDTGRGRSAGDALAISGEKNYNSIAAALRLVAAMEIPGIYKARKDLTNNDFLLMLDEKPAIRQAVNFSISIYKKASLKFISPAMLAAVFFFCSKKHPERVEYFFKRLMDGDNLEKKSSIYQLRNALIYSKLESKRMERFKIAGLIIKAWNYYINGIYVQQFNFRTTGTRPEKFPIIQ